MAGKTTVGVTSAVLFENMNFEKSCHRECDTTHHLHYRIHWESRNGSVYRTLLP